jgi:hypothetical protein
VQKYQKRYFWLCLLAVCIVWNSLAWGQSTAAFDEKSKDNIIAGVLKKEITIMPQLNKLNFGFGAYKGIEYHYEKTVSKLFFQDEKLTANVSDVIIEKSDITLELSHPMLGTGTIKFFLDDKLLKQTSDTDIQKILLETLGDENHQYVFIDPQAKIYHLWSCNLSSNPSPLTRMKREDAEQQGYRASGFCFKKVLYLPQLSIETAIEREWAMRLRDYEPTDRSSEKQALLTEVGKKVLQNWPLKLIGYEYAFYLSQSLKINAFAIPTGKIIVTTALFESLAREEELEALLVYAIAHIEQRHSLKKYHDCIEDEAYADAMKKFATVAGVLAGPAGGGISGAINAALPAASCNPQSLIGYQYDYVQQADAVAALYFDMHGKDRGSLTSLIKKLQFAEMSEKLHPDLRLTQAQEVPYTDRIERIKDSRFIYFKKDRDFMLKRNNHPPVQMNLVYQWIFQEENELHVYVDDKALLQLNQNENNKNKAITLSVTDKAGRHRFTLNDHFLTEDVWGAHLIFEVSAQQKQNFLQDIEKVVLRINPSSGTNDRLNEQAAEAYTFVPGKIDF